ncbi:Tab2 family RNA-binding protein [Candidatus Cyanaurora vandensis]|uniref:Tab2 family RNA-binding protein n=1 Tax=Candidatus Cyanaurora vandensis TaxID=2714958 RepID=UPI00257D1AD3|nr:Tab2 family RNA-binding protein [Candidatus Cyanaurora vandensis]
MLPNTTWEIDIYRRPCFKDDQPLWELLVCTSDGKILLNVWVPLAQVSAEWVAQQLQGLSQQPVGMRVFRRASYQLAQLASEQRRVPLTQSLRTIAIQRWLLARYQTVYPRHPGYRLPARAPVVRPVPAPFPADILPEQWGFSAVPANELSLIAQQPIPYLAVPLTQEDWNAPFWLATVPGVFLHAPDPEPLARWLFQKGPVALSYIESAISGLILETDTSERWVLATFQDPEMKAAGRQFIERLEKTQGLHFVALQPTAAEDLTGFWLLQTPVPL